MDIDNIDTRISAEIDELERAWFAAHRAVEAARTELQLAGISESQARIIADIVCHLDRAENDKHTIMRRIEFLEQSLIN